MSRNSQTCDEESENLLDTCPMSKPLSLNFYIDTSIKNSQYNLDHYAHVITGVLRRFAFMTAKHSDFAGQNRVAIYGYASSFSDTVQISNLWMSGSYHDPTKETWNSLLIDIETTVRDPANIKGRPADISDSLVSIEKHFQGWTNAKAIILRDEDDVYPMRFGRPEANATSPIFISTSLQPVLFRAWRGTDDLSPMKYVNIDLFDPFPHYFCVYFFTIYFLTIYFLYYI